MGTFSYARLSRTTSPATVRNEFGPVRLERMTILPLSHVRTERVEGLLESQTLRGKKMSEKKKKSKKTWTEEEESVDEYAVIGSGGKPGSDDTSGSSDIVMVDAAKKKKKKDGDKKRGDTNPNPKDGKRMNRNAEDLFQKLYAQMPLHCLDVTQTQAIDMEDVSGLYSAFKEICESMNITSNIDLLFEQFTHDMNISVGNVA